MAKQRISSFESIDARIALLRKAKRDEQARMAELRFVCDEHGEQVIRYDPEGPKPEVVCPVCAERARKIEARKKKFLDARTTFMAYAKEPLTEEDEGMTFETFEVTPEKRKNVTACQRFADRFMTRLLAGKEKSATGIFMIGKSGNGKTHLASAMHQRLQAQGLAPVYLRALTLFNLYNPSGGLAANDVTKLLSRVSCLLVDEIGRSSCTTYETNQLLGLLDAREKAGLPTVLITNLEAKDVKGVLGDAFVSRSNKLLYPLRFDWADYRRSQTIATADPMDLF